jgi:RNA polymerase sigma-70 factor (ECF subfamily)
MTTFDDPLDDAELVANVLSGEREAFNPLLLRYTPSVLRLCQRILGTSTEAQDVAQEAALHAFLHLAQLQEPDRFGSWFHAIAANLARMALRRRRILSLDAIESDVAMVLVGATGIPTPEDAYAAREVHDAIITAMYSLSVVNREVVIGYFLNGYTYAELAELLNIPVSTVRGRMFQGRYHLRKALVPYARQQHPNRLLSAPQSKKEATMEPIELVEMEWNGWSFASMHTPYVISLRKRGAARELRIPIANLDELAAIQHARGEKWEAPPPAIMPHLSLRLLAGVEAQIKRVVIRQLTDTAFYTTVTVGIDDQRTEIDVRPGEGLALAAAAGLSIHATRQVLAAAALNVDELNGLPEVQDSFKQRMAVVVDASTPPPSATTLLTPELKARIDDFLQHLHSDIGSTVLLFMHRSGALVSSLGSYDPDALAHYSRAMGLQEQNPRNVADLSRYTGMLLDEFIDPKWWLLIHQEHDWRLELSGPTATDTTVPRFRHAMQELAQLLPVSDSSSYDRLY